MNLRDYQKAINVSVSEGVSDGAIGTGFVVLWPSGADEDRYQSKMSSGTRHGSTRNGKVVGLTCQAALQQRRGESARLLHSGKVLRSGRTADNQLYGQ
jgi:hypothetical protein